MQLNSISNINYLDIMYLMICFISLSFILFFFLFILLRLQLLYRDHKEIVLKFNLYFGILYLFSGLSKDLFMQNNELKCVKCNNIFLLDINSIYISYFLLLLNSYFKSYKTNCLYIYIYSCMKGDVVNSGEFVFKIINKALETE